MALIDDKTLLKLPVYTKSGTCLGKVSGLEFECDSQMVINFVVIPKGITSRILKSPLIIGREQVISITAEKMTVDDNVEKALELAKAKAIGLVGQA